MTTELTLVSTFGWFDESAVAEQLTPISTFGWFVVYILGAPEIVCFTLNILTTGAFTLRTNTVHEVELCF